ncbi:hypothetical protein GGF32_000080 [Allomyces javanicus]|nr:hypothetical protein GGF32_000080 [Allomyces javanicus]
MDGRDFFPAPPAGLDQLIARLPPSVTEMSLSSWNLGGTATLASLVLNLPPRLVSLTMRQRALTDADLPQFVWPTTLRHVDLSSNKITALSSQHLPAHQGLWSLDMGGYSWLTDDYVAWIAALPLPMRVLKISKYNAVDDCVAAALIDRVVAVQRTGSQFRMAVHISSLADISDAVMEELKSKLSVILS